MAMRKLKKAVLKPLDKRIVLLHCKGPWAGMFQILGAQSDTLAELDVAQLPAFIPECEMGDGRVESVSMVKMTNRWVLYRENTPPEGKFNEFHPEQV